MNPQRSNVFLYGTDKYMGMNHKLYRLEELDDEGVAEVMNGGEVIPLIQKT